MTIPEETSVIREETPRERIPRVCFPLKAHRTGRKLFFRRRKWVEEMRIPMQGATQVAKAAPNIPMPRGKIKT